MATKLSIAIGAAFAASLFAASAVNAASLEEQLSLSEGSPGGATQGAEPSGPAGRPAESTGGDDRNLQAQVGLSDGGTHPGFSESPDSGPQGRSAEGGGGAIDERFEAQLKVSDGNP